MPAEFDQAVVDRIAGLTRRLREATGSRATQLEGRRDRLLATAGACLHVRRDDAGEVLVLYPADWVEDGTVDPRHVDDPSRAIEVALTPEDAGDSWSAVMADNMAVADRVREQYGPTHAANAEALATYLANHHRKPIDAASDSQLREFLTEYYPRNVWPTEAQAAVVETSVKLACEVATDDADTA